MKISEIKFVTLFIMGLFFSLFLLANNVNLLRINSYNDEDNFPIDTINIENAYALELDNITNSKIVINNDTGENDKNTTLTSIAEEIGLEKDSKKEIQYQKGAENNVDLKNTTLQNTGVIIINRIIEEYRRRFQLCSCWRLGLYFKNKRYCKKYHCSES